jgi:hypothetical protein
MTPTLKRIPKSKPSAKAAKRHIAKPAKHLQHAPASKDKTLAELNRWMDNNAKEIAEGVRINTLKLTGGKESL